MGVREDDEVATGKILGAKHIRLSEQHNDMKKLIPNYDWGYERLAWFN